VKQRSSNREEQRKGKDRDCWKSGKKGRRTGKVPLTLLQPHKPSKAPRDTGGEARDEDEADGDNVEFGEFVGGEGEGDFVEEKAGSEKGCVDCDGSIG
jgi:hypothetical protein